MGPSPLSSLPLLGEFLEASQSQSGVPNHLSRLKDRDHEEDQVVFCMTQLDLWVTPVALLLRPTLGLSPVTASARHLGPCFCRQGLRAATQHVQAGEVLCPLPSPTPPSPPCETKGRMLVSIVAGCLLCPLPARGWQMAPVRWSCVALATGLGAAAATRRKHSARLS